MAETPPVDPVYDGTNVAETIQAIEDANPGNPPVRGGVQLEPPTPGAPREINIELANGVVVKVIEGNLISAAVLVPPPTE